MNEMLKDESLEAVNAGTRYKGTYTFQLWVSHPVYACPMVECSGYKTMEDAKNALATTKKQYLERGYTIGTSKVFFTE